MEHKKRSYDKKKMAFILQIVLLNIVLIICIILSVVTAFQDAKEASFSQNIENVRTLTDASANKVELEISHHTYEVKALANYVNDYAEGIGMTQDEVCSYFQSLFSKSRNESCSWQLVDSRLNEGKGENQGFNAISLSGAEESFCYHTQGYTKLAPNFAAAAEETVGEIYYTSEFMDAGQVVKSFAIATPLRIRSEGTVSYEYKTLMMLIRSDYINQLLYENNDTDILNFFDYSNIIIDNDGNYVISNSSFQGTNFIDYIELYNGKLPEKTEHQLQKNLCASDYSDVLFYKNGRGQDCAYTIVPVQDSDWHILSIVPLESFHNAYDYNRNFILFTMFFGLLSMVDIIFILSINRQLRHRTKEAQDANYAKSEFLSAMSHDIRTPMNAIIGMTLLAEEAMQGETVEVDTLQDSIQTIKHSGNHLLTLINDILDISKIENGKLVISPANFSIRENMMNMLEILDPEVKKKHLKLETDINQIEHEYIYADELRINQIYINILSNAIKYTNPGGTISVTLREELVEEAVGTGKRPIAGQELTAGQKARFFYQVKDTGIGMTPDFLATIFDRFSRAVDTRVNVTQGTGLGMAITKQLVDLLGGTITVESELNKGSTFSVVLELEIQDKKTEAIMRSRKEAERHKVQKQNLDLSILVVEDNDINWKILDKLLIKYGIHANRAENGQVAVDIVKNRAIPYDVILMDVQMPVMNGYAATAAIRKIGDVAKAATPIYAMTADTFAEDITKCREAGMNGHLSKPIELDKLEQILMGLSG